MARGDAAPGSPPATAALSEALVALFPRSVAGAITPVGGGQDAPAHPDERAVVAGAAAGRRAQFLAGRACAHAALRALGRDTPVLARGPTRAPVWPPGVVGAIAHTAQHAGAVAARARDAWGLGLDLEPLAPPLDDDVERLVLSPAERAAARPAHPLGPFASKVAFCAKECVYKCVSPAAGWPLDFHDVRVRVDLPGGRFQAVVDERFRVGGAPLPPLAGRFAVVGGVVLAGLRVGPLTG